MNKLAPALLLLLVSTPLSAAAPPFETAAPVAYMVDLSSGAVLYSKDADRRMPPASMAKMMTVYVAFDLIRKGELKLDQKLTVNPETWRKWHGPAAGSTMFLSPNEQVSVLLSAAMLQPPGLLLIVQLFRLPSAGSGSLSTTFRAVPGPVLVTTIVKLMFCPML